MKIKKFAFLFVAFLALVVLAFAPFAVSAAPVDSALVLAETPPAIDWSAIVTQVLVIVVPMIALSVLGLISSGVRYLWAKGTEAIKQKNPDLYWKLENAAELAVHAAEQKKKQVQNDPALMKEIEDMKLTVNEYIKDYAVSVAEKALTAQGLEHVDWELIGDAVEAALNKKNAADVIEIEPL